MQQLDPAKLFKGQRVDADQLELLSRVLSEFSSSLATNETLRDATELIKGYMHAEGVSIFLLENDDRELACRYCAGEADIKGIRIGSDQGIIGRSLRENAIQLVSNAADDPDFFSGVDEQSGAKTRSLICAPMMIEGRNIGAIEVINKLDPTGQFGEKDGGLLQVLATATALAIHNARMAERLIGQERTRKELELAREIQRGFLPGEVDALPCVTGINVPARTVSGDFFDYHRCEEGPVFFCLGDVAGKGINASLMVAHINALLRFLRKQKVSPAYVLNAINGELSSCSLHGFFTTMVAGVCDPDTGRVRMVNAGHQPPLYVSASGEIQEYTLAAPPLGVLPQLELEEFEIDLAGGALYIFSDGLTECWTAPGVPLEVDGVRHLIHQHGNLPLGPRLQAIVDDATAWKRSHSGFLHDDITVLALQGG